MRKSSALFAIAAAFAAVSLNAEIVLNSDENTAWLENGKGIKNGGDTPSLEYWRNGITLLPNPSGEGFIFDSNDEKKYATGCYMVIGSEYPWLEWEITKVEPIPGKYLAFSITTSNPNAANSDTAGKVPTGIFVRNLNDRGDFTEQKTIYLNIYSYNSKITLKYLKLVKQPECAVEMLPKVSNKTELAANDEVTIKVTLKNPAESVSVDLVRAYAMQPVSINGSSTIALKAEENSGNKVWSAVLPLTSLPAEPKEFLPGQLLFKTTITGNDIKVPVWGTNSYKIKCK